MAMEDESLAGVEAAPQGLVLNELAANETSLVALAKTLLSPRTLPHHPAALRGWALPAIVVGVTRP